MEDLLLELAEERDLLEVIFDSMVEGVIATDRSGQVVFFNSAAEHLFGFQEDVVLGKDLREQIPDGELQDIITSAMETGERIYEAEVKLLEPVGRILRVNIIPLIDRTERFFGTVVLVIDITERRASQRRLEQAEKLAAQTTLSAGIAHEIRNPLNSLSIHLQLAKKNLGDLRHRWKEIERQYPQVEEPGSFQKIEGNLQVIRDEVERLDTVVKNFLLAVRPQQPNWSFSPIDPLITSTLRLLEPEFSQHHIRIVYEPLEEELLVPVDEHQIRQALINLLRNAIEATESGGEIGVRLHRLPDRLRIQILDNGEGISEEDLRHVFEPYFTRRPSGTGLGLSVVDRIVREHNGRIHIESELGQGTCVTMELPLSKDTTRQLPIFEDLEKDA